MGRVLVFGSVNRDLVVRVPKIPRPGETIGGTNYQEFPGGKGGNQAVAAARMGVATSLIGAIGCDGFGRAMRDFLDGEGIDLTMLAECPAHPTGIALITVDAAAENAIVVAPGANHQVSAAQLDGFAFAAGDCLVSQFEVPLPAISLAFARARSAGAITILNPAPMLDMPAELLGLTDYLVLNEHELASIAATGPLADLDSCRAAMAGLRGSVGSDLAIIVTLGGDGCLAATQQGEIRVAGERVAAVDTTGAGDCFVGVLAAGLVEGLALPMAMARANRAAALSVTRAGAASAMPRRDDLN